MVIGQVGPLVDVLRLDGQRGNLVPWIPICLGVGIGLYFSFPAEPSGRDWTLLGLQLALGLIALVMGLWRAPLAVALVLILCGVGLAGLRTGIVAGPVLDWRYYGPVEGRVVAVDRSASDKVRITLDRVLLERVGPSRTPRRVRVSLHGQQDWLDPSPGQRVILTAHLSRPQGPVEPGGFDFQRMAWFKGLGAVGYSRAPALLISPDDGTRPIGRARMMISDYVRSVLPGETGAFAAAITTGDRSAMGQDTLDALRKSNLAHLLAISGLHMGLLTGAAFAALRLGLALVPGVALTRPVKKYAAMGALVCGAMYLALSGGNVATQRAFIMAAVMLIAVCLDRRAVTLRAVAVSATIVLLLRPEAITEPGFQMSFAATTALVAAFRLVRDHAPRARHKWLRAVGAVVLSSAVAGLATAPFGAAHFNQISHFGLIANVMAVPLMGVVVMPAALLTAALAPIGLGWIGLIIMKPAIDWIMLVAHRTADLPNSVSHVPAPPGGVLAFMSMGFLVLILWCGKTRWGGLAAAALSFIIWLNAERPDVLISPSGGLVGVMQDKQRVLSKPKGDGFAARVWLENDGLVPDQRRAAADANGAAFDLDGIKISQISGRGAAERALTRCAEGGIVVVSVTLEAQAGPCILLGPETLAGTGAVAIDIDDGTAEFTTARGVTGARPWNIGPPIPRLLGNSTIRRRGISNSGSTPRGGPEP